MKKSRAKPSGFRATQKKSRAKPSGFGATSKKVELAPEGSGYPEKKKGWPLRILQGGELCNPSIEK